MKMNEANESLAIVLKVDSHFVQTVLKVHQ